MSISPIGASSVSALVLSRLLGNSDSSSSTESASSLGQSDLDSLFISPEAQWMSRTQSGNPFKADLDNLGSLIQSGDLDSAKTAYAAMLEKMQAHQGGQDAVSTEFAAIGKALGAGDATAAQSAWSGMQATIANMGSGQGPANPMQRDMDKLSSLIASGDLTSASALFENIQEKVKSHGSNATGTDTSGSSSTLEAELSALETALKSGDTTSAKTAFNALQSDLQKAPPPPPTSNSSQNVSGVSDLDVLLLSSYWNYPGLSAQLTGNASYLT